MTRLVVVVCAAIFVATFTIVYAGVNSIGAETWPDLS